MITLEASVEGEKQLSRKLMIMSSGVENWEEPLTSIATELRQSFEENFEARGALFGGWEPRKKEYPWPLLEKSGTMRDSFEQELHKDYVVLSNSAPYFKYHQSNKPRNRLPRRVMMKIDAARKTYIVKAFQEYIVKLTRS
jgi:phage gpG-like protein